MELRAVAGLWPVYNLTVEDAHCYYAADILVSNCNAAEYLMTGEFELLSGNPSQDLRVLAARSEAPRWDPLSEPRRRRAGSWMVR